jgi:hypothetical protein
MEEYLNLQGRFAYLTPEDIKFFQGRIDESWESSGFPASPPSAPKRKSSLYRA